jgi:hypothetical protein
VLCCLESKMFRVSQAHIVSQASHATTLRFDMSFLRSC